MHGRTALAALLVSTALYGCGQEATVAPARIEIESGPPPPSAKAVASAAAAPHKGPPPRPGRTRRGTLKMPQTVPAPSAAGVPARTQAVPATRPTRKSVQRFRAAHLSALRAHCATRPPADPRCVNGRVDERVAFAAFEDPR